MYNACALGRLGDDWNQLLVCVGRVTYANATVEVDSQLLRE